MTQEQEDFLDLRVVEDIEECEGPILTLSTDGLGNLFVEKWADLGHNLVVRTTKERILAYREGRLSMLDLLKADEDRGWIAVLHVGKPTAYRKCKISEVKPSYLPDPDAMHDVTLAPRRPTE